ncbi:hypothetical protein LIS77_12810 [Cytobacillus firmus]|uniref:hypothetical protein n=1 Tax=Cytobacillus firmus TaxID=1399 RepID=UPI00207A0660|nr:hypothetical protein [Cytobacillus firmus]USK36829.1 hypothetical protein LIS77_12810 [Cytobacillus firmus]
MMSEMGLHETLELHELLVFKNLCLIKSVAMGGMSDQVIATDFFLRESGHPEYCICPYG